MMYISNAFFKQFVHPSLRTEIISSENFINLEGDSESPIVILSDKEIINICRIEIEDVTQTDVEEVALFTEFYRNPLNKNVAPKAENSLVRRRSPPSFTAKLLRAQGGDAH